MNIFGFLMSMFDSVPQDPDAVLYALLNGVHVRMRPTVGSDGRITEWRAGDVVVKARTLRDHVAATLDTVPQNPNEVRLSPGGIRLRPVFGKCGMIVDWIEDPDVVECIAAAVAAEAAAHPPPTLPGDSQTPADPQPQDGTGGFNPAGMNGL